MNSVWSNRTRLPPRVPPLRALSGPWIHCKAAPAPSKWQLLMYGEVEMLQALSPLPSKSVGKVWTAVLVLSYFTFAAETNCPVPTYSW